MTPTNRTDEVRKNAPNYSLEELSAFKHDLRNNVLIKRFGMCSRGPIAFEMMAAIWGVERIKELWEYESR